MTTPIYSLSSPAPEVFSEPFELAGLPARFEDVSWWSDVVLRDVAATPPVPVPSKRQRLTRAIRTTADRLSLAWDVLRGNHVCLED